MFLPGWKDDAENRQSSSDDILAAINDNNVINTDVNEMPHCQRAHLTSIGHCVPITLSMSIMSIKYLYSANSRRWNLRRWRVGDRRDRQKRKGEI